MSPSSSLWRLGITITLVGFTLHLPATAGAQPPVYLTQWGSFGFDAGQFVNPMGVATDPAGDVYVVDQINNRVQKFSATGAFITQWGSTGSANGQFRFPVGVATDAAGDVYVVDAPSHGIQKFTGTGTYLTRWGSFGVGNGQFRLPHGVATDIAGHVYVTEHLRVQSFTGTGDYLAQWGSFTPTTVYPNVAIGPSGDVFLVDTDNHRVLKFTATGAFITEWGSQGNGNGQFNIPTSVATDAEGNVYVTDGLNCRVQKFTGAGTYLTQWGSYGGGDGQLGFPLGLATDANGNIYVADSGNYRIQKFGPAKIEMAFDFTPGTLNLASRGLWITAFLEPLAPLAATDIDVSSIRVNGAVPLDPSAPTVVGDRDGNGVPDLMVKFSRVALQLTLPEGEEVAVNVSGKLAGESFAGIDYIRVRRVGVSAPLAGSHVTAGTVTQVRWDTPSSVKVQWVALLQSFDNGGTWSLIAHGQPNSGIYDWTVPNVQAAQTKVAVVLTEASDPTGEEVDGVLGVSETFSIDAIVGVGDHGSPLFALRGVTPNPAQGHLRVSFSLRGSRPATLALFDVSGRQLTSRRVDGMGPGWHTVTLGGRSSLPVGLYLIRLTQEEQSLTTRAALVR